MTLDPSPRQAHFPLRFRRLLALPLLLLITSAVYWSGLHGPYVFDDYNNIVDNPNLNIEGISARALWQASVAGDAGPLKRPLSMLSFALNRLATGLDPFWFKLTNLAIHLLNGILVYFLCRELLSCGAWRGTREQGLRLALLTSAIWLLHPVQLTSVLYVVQRMTSLSATFVLAGLIVYLRARQSSNAARCVAGLWLGVPLFTALAALAKENGVLLIAYAFVIEATLFRFATVPDWKRGTPTQFFSLFLVLPLFAVAGFLLSHPDWLARAAETRDFDAAERMLTEARVLFLYLWMLLLPAISNLALFYDDLAISRSLLDPPATLFAVIALVVLATAAWTARRRSPWFAFAVLWFLAGHAMESTFILLELVHPHRNYVAYLGPMLGLVLAANAVLQHVRGWLPPLVAASVLLALAGTTALRAHQWSNPLDLAIYEVNHRPNSARANYELARLLHQAAQGTGDTSLNANADQYLARAARLAPTEIGALVGQVMIAEGAADSAVIRELTRRLAARPLFPNQVGTLHSLVLCQRKQKCKTPPDQLQAVFTAALNQPRLRPRVKADLLTILGTYYAEQLGDAPAALRVMREAAKLDPEDPSRWLNLAQILLFLPDYDAAERQLQLAERADPLGVTRWRSDKIKADIHRFRAQSGDAKRARDPEPLD